MSKNSSIVFVSRVLLFVGAIFVLLYGCEEFEPERIVRMAGVSVMNINRNSAYAKGTFLDVAGEEVVFQHGFCWSTFPNPTRTSYAISLGEKIAKGDFFGTLSGLEAETRYYVRAYAVTSEKTIYSEQTSFITQQAVVPSVMTNSVSGITETSAKSGGNVSSDGGTEVTARGVCWDTIPHPTLSDYYTADDSGTGSFVSTMTGLSSKTTYYVRAYASNKKGTAYGIERHFTTN